LGEVRADQTRHAVGRAPRRERNDRPDRLCRIGLRLRHGCRERERQGEPYSSHDRSRIFRAQPSLILASFTTRLHFSISAATKARKSSGVFGRYSTLRVFSRSVTAGSFSIAFSPALSFCTIAAGVPVGTNTPFHS